MHLLFQAGRLLQSFSLSIFVFVGHRRCHSYTKYTNTSNKRPECALGAGFADIRLCTRPERRISASKPSSTQEEFCLFSWGRAAFAPLHACLAYVDKRQLLHVPHQRLVSCLSFCRMSRELHGAPATRAQSSPRSFLPPGLARDQFPCDRHQLAAACPPNHSVVCR